MGIDFHGLNFLRFARTQMALGEVVTIGRQELHVNAVALKGLIDLKPTYRQHAYCEELLTDYLGAKSVESIDNSSYEDATHICDMSAPLPPAMFAKYDTLVDAGTTEHIFNVPQALRNYSDLVRPGGQIIHVLPANNYCGHGFWQFSPELFFSLYAPKNGYRDTRVFVSDLTEKWTWGEVIAPSNGKRVNIYSSNELYVMVRTTKAEEGYSHANVQQSDYMYEWENSKATPQPMLGATGIKGRIMNIPIAYDTLFPLYQKLLRLRSPDRLSRRNPGLRMVDVRSVT